MRKPNISHAGSGENSERKGPSLLSPHNQSLNADLSFQSASALAGDPSDTKNFISMLRRPTVQLVSDSLPAPKPLFSSKTPVKLAVFSGKTEAAVKLIEEGYPVSPKLIFEPIFKKEFETVQRILSLRIYDSNSLDLIFWLFLKFEMEEEAKIILKNEGELRGYFQDTDLSNSVGILNRDDILHSALDQSLELGIDFAACLLLKHDYKLVSFKRLEKALEKGCVNFLKIIWTGDLVHDVDSIIKVNRNSEIWSYLTGKYGDVENMEVLKRHLKASKLLIYYLERGRVNEVRKIMAWKILRNSLKVLRTLTESINHDLGGEYLLTSTLTLTTDQFISALSNRKFETCLIMLRYIPEKIVLDNMNTQKKIIELLCNSSTCILAIETLKKLDLRYWKSELTRDLCLTLTSLIRKSKSIIFCKDILLFTVLVILTLEKFKSSFEAFKAKCETVMQDYLELSLIIIEELADEETLKYHLLTKSSSGATVLEQIAKYRLLKLLESDNIELIVYKLWNGNENCYDIYAASSLYKMIISPIGSGESLQFMKGIDMGISYNFQLVNIKSACRTRFLGQSFASFALIILYYIFLFFLIENDSFLYITSEASQKYLFGVVLTIVFGITVEQILNTVYNIKEKEKFEIDSWKINNWIIALLVIFISIELPRLEYQNGWVSYDSAYLGSGIINSIMFMLLCNKFWDISKTFPNFGPLISMCFKILQNVISFLLIYAAIILCSSGVFSLLFMETSGYEQLDYSFRTLYMATVGPFDITSFAGHKQVFGAIMLGFFQLISHVLLLNLLVGVVESIFKNFQLHVESEYRSVLITKYYENKWSDRYGVLIFLPYPINFCSLIVSPFVLIGKEKVNEFFTKIFYVTYAVPYLTVFVLINLICLPFCYLKGFLVYGKVGRKVPLKQSLKIFDIPDDREKIEVTEFSYFKSLLWTVIGPFWLLYACLRDCLQFWRVAYLEAPIREPEPNEDLPEIDEMFFKNLIKALATFSDETVTVKDLFQKFKELDVLCNESSEERDIWISETLTRISNPDIEGKINCLIIRKLFAKKGEFRENDVQRFKHFHLLLICKAFMHYRKSYVSLKGSKMKEGFEIDVFYKSMAEVEGKVSELKGKVKDLLDNCIDIVRSQNDGEDID